MTEAEIRSAVLQALATVVPEAENVEIDPELALRDQVEMDSMDFVAFVMAIEEGLATRIPELEYPRLSSLAGALRYLGERLG